MNLKKDFGKRLKELRTKSGITQCAIAEIVGIDPKHLSHIETGKSFPKADLIEKFALALNVDYTSLFKTNHLKNKEELIESINANLKNLDDEKIKEIYKIISAFIE